MFTPGWRACAYRTASGRAKWPNRDPFGERGGLNLYGFVANNPVNWIDTDGRAIMPPMPPRMPPPDTVIQKCNRKIENDENDLVIGIANTRGHNYFGWPDPNGGTDGVGFRDPNGQDGDLPQSEAGSKARSCRPCYKSNSPLKYGKGAGKPGTSASNDDIKDCLKNRPIKGNYHGLKNNCNDWARGAEKDCGLFCP